MLEAMLIVDVMLLAFCVDIDDGCDMMSAKLCWRVWFLSFFEPSFVVRIVDYAGIGRGSV